MPHFGGISARAMVTITADQLLQTVHDSGVALLDDLIAIPAWQARRIACEAGILPAVLAGESEILDLGRSRRFHNEPQRIVIHQRDKTCRAEGCDWPAATCHVHHPVPFSRGGPTDLNGMTLCPPAPPTSPRPHLRDDEGQAQQVVFRGI